ncbi:MAG TPA: methyltransferase domain-containing protein [Candidatus Eremiobacteraceae bacterium]|jgi:ubiquinone/menaquinone biosynthesis C-methylase UbiE
MSRYLLAQSPNPEAERQRLALLQEYYDPWTIARLEKLGVAAGWRCLDVGAGAGSIAQWLAQRVGASGSVFAIDLDLRLLEPLATSTLTVHRLDVCAEELPKDADLVYSRLLLEHLPERETVLQRMIRALRPGGLIVVIATDFRTVRFSEPDAALDRVTSSFAVATQTAGWNIQVGPALASMLENAGLVDVAAESWQSYDRGGAASTLVAMTYRRLRDSLIQHGAGAADIEEVIDRLASASVGMFSPTSWMAWGRRNPRRD